MRALVFRGPGKVEVADVAEPEIAEPSDAIVRVSAAPICGSDLHLYHGRLPGLMEGTTLGHMLVGRVEETGPDVTRVEPGARVVGSFLIPCGRCWWCERAEYNNCNNVGWRVLGYGIFLGDLQGSQAERVRVPEADLTLLPVGDDLADEQVVFVGDSLATGFYAARTAGIRPGDAVAVAGCGPVGLFTLMYARTCEPGALLALDSVPARLEAAEALGATPIDISRRNAVVAVAEATGQRGADVAIDCVGAPDAFLDAFNMLRAGGHLVVIGVYVELEAPFPLGEAWRKNIRMTFAGVTPVMRHWEEVLDSVRAGAVDPSRIVTHVLPLEEGARGYELFDRKEALQVVLKP